MIFESRLKPASRPTTALPGSEEKVLVLEARLKAGEELWHPDDVRSESESYGLLWAGRPGQ